MSIRAPLPRFRDQLEGRSMLVRRARMIEIECVARGYISGSGWKEYRENGTVCGIRFRPACKESDKLPEPIFTPATKAQTGHDENVSFEHVAALIGADLAGRLRDLTLNIYTRAARYAETRGIIIADTKFEFGFVGDELVLGDEVLDARFLALLARGHLPARRARSIPSTSNLCAITWNRFTGTNSRRLPRCRRKWRPRPRRNTARHTACSRGASYEYWVLLRRELPSRAPPELADHNRRWSAPLADYKQPMNWLDVVLLLIVVLSVASELPQRARARGDRPGVDGRGHAAGRLVLWNRGGLSLAVPGLPRGREPRLDF